MKCFSNQELLRHNYLEKQLYTWGLNVRCLISRLCTLLFLQQISFFSNTLLMSFLAAHNSIIYYFSQVFVRVILRSHFIQEIFVVSFMALHILFLKPEFWYNNFRNCSVESAVVHNITFFHI